jgi:hypothetical protein
MRRHHLIHVMAGAFLALLAAAANTASAQLYSAAELESDAVRLRNAVQKIYFLGIKPSLTSKEQRALDGFEFSFPMPQPGDDLMNFHATTDDRTLVMPLESLKMLEDLTTAYAWLYHEGYNLSTIDLYFAMLRYRGKTGFPGGEPPAILPALGVPSDAYKTSKKVDELSLSLRNEAFAFIIVHELGHILFRHKPLDQISAKQAQDDEIESDRFALDVFRRTGTPALGPTLFFQAQIYRLLHRHEFKSQEAWRKHVQLKMTHPLSVSRIRSMADFIEGPLLASRPAEAGIWPDIAAKLRSMTDIMDDIPLARCVAHMAKTADLSILRRRKGVARDEMMARCKG